jgi:hypothetical protein
MDILHDNFHYELSMHPGGLSRVMTYQALATINTFILRVLKGNMIYTTGYTFKKSYDKLTSKTFPQVYAVYWMQF